MRDNLNTRIVRAMIGLTLLACAVVYFGLLAYFFFIYDWLYPDAPPYDDSWRLGDAVMLGLLLGIAILAALLFGWRLARPMIVPLKSVAAAARRLAEGDFSARADLPPRTFKEAGDLVADFNQMAERLQRAEAELSYSNSAIAHELRTPLTILRGRLQGLLDGVFEPSPELYGRLIEHVDDLSGIVEELRTLALGNAGQLDLQYARLDLAQEAEAALGGIDHQLAAAGITVSRSLASVAIRGDRARLRQAMIAVLDNCRRYAPQASVHVETAVTGDFAVFRCIDTGPGLSAESRTHAFERFWRADDSRGRSLGGSGLGLPIVRTIARAHGGEALLLPPDGPGLGVEIRLPRQI
ncbi:ATP-binding protein [Rhizobium straminoryzae]|nr:ATP-binding protein [Rhizobium straminoryzae]